MRNHNKQVEAFFELFRAGLWEQGVRLLPYGPIDFSRIYQLAEEQSVVGLIAAGLEHVLDAKLPKQSVLQFIGQTLQQEERNKAMNYFIGVIIDKMRNEGIYTVLVKGQGVAQLYGSELSMLRQSGDIDLWVDGGMKRAMTWARTNYGDVAFDYINAHIPMFKETEVELH